MRKKRFLAVVLAATLALGSSVTAFASVSSTDITSSPVKGTVEGKARLEGALDEDVFKVEVPTVPLNDPTFNFIMDPQNLIERTQGAKYLSSNTNMDKRDDISVNAASDIDYSTLYFANRDANGTVSQLSSSSNSLTIKNKSTMDVTVGLTATVTDLGKVGLSTNSQVSNNVAPSLYLAMLGEDLSGNDARQEAISDNGASMSARVSGCDADYIVSVNSANEYDYTLSSNSVNFAGYSFKLTGASGGGQYADWAAVEKATKQPKVTVTWNIVPYVAPIAPSITGSKNVTKVENKAAIFDIDLGQGAIAAKGIKSITFQDGGTTKTVPAGAYEFSNGQLRITVTHLSYVTATRQYTVTFDNSASTTDQFTITVTP